MKENKESEGEEDEDIEIDFSKITNFFRRKKKKVESQEDKIERSIIKEEKKIEDLKDKKEEIEEKEEQEEKKIENLEEKEEKIDEEIEKEKEKIERLEEKKEKIEEKEIKIEKAEDEMEEKEEDLEIDFSKIKSKIAGIFRKGKAEEKKEEDGEEEISIDVRKTAAEIAKFSKKHATLLLILIPIFLSIWFRAYPISLPATDDWAEDSVHGMIRRGIANDKISQYPNLPDQQRNEIVEKEFKDFLKQNKAAVEQQIEGTSNYFKSRLQDEDGNTYLLAIDPYFWHTYAKNYLNNGTYHDAVNEEGVKVFSLRNGRFGKRIDDIMLNPSLGIWLYRFMHFFNGSTTLASAMFLLPLLIITLSVIPAFFIGKRIAGNVGGVFAGIILVLNRALLSRTPAGFADTDAYNVFFPLLIAWAVLAAIDQKETKKRVIYAALGGLAVGFFSYAWNGWPFMFDVALASLGIYFIANAALNWNEIRKDFRNLVVLPIQKNVIAITAMFIFAAGIVVTYFRGFEVFARSFIVPIQFMTMKQVAVSTLWPNVLTTVAEFNEIPLKGIISQMGGKVLFIIAVVGIALAILKWRKENWSKWGAYPILILTWFIATSYSFTKGLRFAVLIVPAFAIAFGAGIGLIYEYVIPWSEKELNIKKKVGKPVLVLLFCLLLIAPLNDASDTALREVPSMNDAWHESLTAIKDNSTDAITTSWWDFGHWFVSVTERRVTFDGADQGRRIHWVGKSLLTDDENTNIGILRMLNCGQEDTFDVLDKYINDGAKSIKILNEIILLNRDYAKRVLAYNGLSDEESEEVLELSHCEDLISQYYITSDDMIGKAGVWGHFGSWNFTRAAIFNDVKNNEYEESITIMTEKYSLPQETADAFYYEIQENDADRWVSGWPGYRSGLIGCSAKGNIVKCGDTVTVDLSSKKATISVQGAPNSIPHSLVYADKEDVHEEVFKNSTVPVSVVLVPSGKNYMVVLTDPLHAKSIFTRLFFFRGHGLRHYELLTYKKSFTGNEIYVWKVDFEPHEPIIIDEFKEEEADIAPTTEENANASLNTTGNSAANNS